MRKNQGFTLVEILIVVVILGILAAIVIPQFSDASTQSKESSLKSSLQTMRSQISLYKIQHNDAPPAVDSFATEMTGYTDVNGDTWVEGTSTGTKFGPYLQAVPTNPFTTGTTVGTGTTNDWNYTVSGNEATIFAGADTTADTAVHQAY